MYPWFRFAKEILKQHPPLESIWDTTELDLRIWPNDIDFFFEVNNGRFLTLMDLGRIGLYFRSGAREAIKRNKWGGAVAGASVRYRKRLHMFQKCTMYTRLLGADHRWLYMGHSIERQGTIHVSALLRIAVTDKNGIVPIQTVAEQTGIEINQVVPDWVQSWDKSDQERPWITMRDVL